MGSLSQHSECSELLVSCQKVGGPRRDPGEGVRTSCLQISGCFIISVMDLFLVQPYTIQLLIGIYLRRQESCRSQSRVMLFSEKTELPVFLRTTLAGLTMLISRRRSSYQLCDVTLSKFLSLLVPSCPCLSTGEKSSNHLTQLLSQLHDKWSIKSATYYRFAVIAIGISHSNTGLRKP